MRILLLTQFFQPEPNFKGLPFAKELARRGHDVEVLTGFPNYPGGRIYPGYQLRPVQRQHMEGIPVWRVPLYPSHDRSPMRRSANYLSFFASASILGPLLVKPVDVVHVHHAPVTAGLAAMVFRVLRRTPFLYDIHDLWPDSLVATGMVRAGAVLRAVDLSCRLVYRAASKIAVASPGFKTALCNRGVPSAKVEVVYTWCDESGVEGRRDESVVEQLGLRDKFVVLFAGTMGLAQGLDTLLDAAALLRTRAPDVRVVFVGGGVDRDRLERRATDLGLVNTMFLPRRPVSAMGPLLAAADVLMVHLRDEPLFRITVPSKTQAYLAAGRPVLMAVTGDAARLIERSAAGMVCAPSDPAAIADAVVRLRSLSPAERQQLGDNGRAFYRRELSLHAGVDKFERMFAEIAKR